MPKRIFALFILACMTIPLIACASNDKGDDTVATTTTGEIQTGPDPYDDELGDWDFNNETITFFSRSHAVYNYAVDFEEMPEDPLDVEIYMRNREIEDRFNINIAFFSDAYNTASAKARAAITAGTNEYDIITTRCPDAYVFAQDGIIREFSSMTEIDLTKPYWDMALTDQLTVVNKRYFAVGAFNLTAYDFVHVLLFNKKLVSDLGLDNPYDHVNNGTWTYDVFEQMGKANVRQLDGNDVMDDKDSWGYLSNGKQVLPCFWVAAGVKGVEKNAEDIPYCAMGEEKFINVFNRIFEVMYDSQLWFKTTAASNLDPAIVSMFQNNQALFMDNTFFYIKDLRNMEADFGILPFPKWNASQEKYYSRMEGCELFMLPISMSDENAVRASVILEAMASLSAKNVIPEYYEVALKTKAARDEDSEKMIDILFENRVFDFSDTIWTDTIRDPVIAGLFNNNRRDIVSSVTSISNTVEKTAEKMVAAFENVD